eukprot:9487514-Pyramimonas_sp.AAC.1
MDAPQVLMPGVPDPPDGNPSRAGTRNADVKVVSVINHGLAQIATRAVPWTQRGFVAHRSFMTSVLELDVAAH